MSALPAVVAAGVALALGAGEIGALAAGVAAGGLCAFLLARHWIGQASALARWIIGLGGGEEGQRPAVVLGSALEWILWPTLDLARRLKRAERLSALHARRLSTVLDALADPVLLVDQRSTIVEANAAARRTFEIERAGVPLTRVTRDPGVLAALNSVLATKAASSVSFSPIDDRLKLFAAYIAPLETPDGGGGAVIALREQSEQLLIERMRSDFVANASHELKTPLAAIIGIIETLRGPARDDPAAREMFLATMAEEASRMQRLVEDLLSLSQIELAARRPPAGRVSLRDVLEGTLARMRPMAEAARVRLVLEAPPDLPDVVADADQLHQLFGNLVDNAIKYGGPDKEVRIEVRLFEAAPPGAGPVAKRKAVEIAVVDQGEGIAPEHLPRLTERFYRVDKGRSRKIGGTGLGLAIVKHIVRRHQGHLAIESELGKGSRFAVFLPVPADGRHEIVTRSS
ncbi:MAG: ATP-binding protein [Geminicoccaceae bacterium]|nr:ATP-binding protein [Geminicoccaceae bacterium]MCS7266571.1 ATP-binding protein [Geminicoccaceae bacterium]MDW8123204.1 ATP-binding protein [Geminicoccaceae bacterium]MDW8340136.1 ATP-binding protein [Geminicoccaceae bacterium]